MKMKKLLCLIISMFVLASVAVKADIGVSFIGGVSIPQEDLAKVYNKDSFDIVNPQQTLNVITDALHKGYHIGICLNDKNDNIGLSVIWNRFPKSELLITNTHRDEIARLQLIQDLFQVNLGTKFDIVNSFIDVYGLGELSYNYTKNTTNLIYKKIPIPLDLNDEIDFTSSASRLGYVLGVGIKLDLSITQVFVEGKYNVLNNILNIIKFNNEENEPSKSFVSITLGVRF